MRSKILPFVLVPALTSASLAQIATFCPQQPNSTGATTTLTGSLGSGVGSGLHLEVTGGVPGEFGYVLVGNEVTPALSISNGLLCMGASATARVYRFDVPGMNWYSVGQFDNAGVMQNLGGTSTTGSGYDVPSTIPNSVPISITAGDTWHFQFWHRDSAAAPGASNFSNGLSVTFGPTGGPIPGMVVIPAGTFFMGSAALGGAPYFGSTDTEPVHPVTISTSFWMGEHEVTQADYLALMGSNPSYFSGLNRPVERVTWSNARAYCMALTVQQANLGNVPAGFEYRLPTEAEWEYACRAGTTTEFNVGAGLYCGDAKFWYSYHSNTNCSSTETDPVGSYAPNAWGLYDMHGNVMEWCLDSHASYAPGAASDPFVTGGTSRVLRGGGWYYNTDYCRSAYRSHNGPGSMSNVYGFRIVLAPIRVP
ncbi:MAG: formylglycine-generating enzyme family protein [Planctomycetes bacterium]|nr:formylglycine-generating enzyme family protein [Polyangiaceae bacterium]MCB9910015.1 formylglycine-generating enzyme family protein [Planctomycetota bacterium]